MPALRMKACGPMNPAQKALWFIERHLANELTLDEIAGVGEVSRYHMVRAFAAGSRAGRRSAKLRTETEQ